MKSFAKELLIVMVLAVVSAGMQGCGPSESEAIKPRPNPGAAAVAEEMAKVPPEGRVQFIERNAWRTVNADKATIDKISALLAEAKTQPGADKAPPKDAKAK